MRTFLAVIACCLALAGCHSSKSSARWEDPIYAKHDTHKGKKSDKKKDKTHGKTTVRVRASADAQRVIEVAYDWLGTPYLYGGNTRRGVDCSGLVCIAFDQGAGIKLPRSSSDQADWCTRISRESLMPGDLVFFTNKRGGSRINHVAIYVGDNNIVHSTTSRGVIVSCLDEEYWRSHFHCCGRALK